MLIVTCLALKVKVGCVLCIIGAEDTTDAEDTIDAAGGDHVLASGLFAVGGVLNSIYAVGQAYDSYRYWHDYYRNTGVRPRYPWRAGQYDWMADVGHGMYSAAYWFKR